MRIHVNKIDNNQPIYGALVFDLINFIKSVDKIGETILFFQTKKHEQVYCSVFMAKRISERQRLNGHDDSVIMGAIKSLSPHLRLICKN
jgi:hypothetical protein